MLHIDDLAHSVELTEEALKRVRGGFFGEVMRGLKEMQNQPTYGEIIREVMENAGK